MFRQQILTVQIWIKRFSQTTCLTIRNMFLFILALAHPRLLYCLSRTVESWGSSWFFFLATLFALISEDEFIDIALSPMMCHMLFLYKTNKDGRIAGAYASYLIKTFSDESIIVYSHRNWYEGLSMDFLEGMTLNTYFKMTDKSSLKLPTFTDNHL